jgi:K+ transporter
LIGKEARNVPADIVHEDNSALARVARKTTPGAALAALGIVYGDLGTSPLYTLQAVVGATGGHFSREAALGGLSLIFWALIISISVKYCLFAFKCLKIRAAAEYLECLLAQSRNHSRAEE